MRWLSGALAAALLCAGCDNQGCKTVAADVGALCLPDTIASGTAASIDVQELCGVGCARQPGCTASFTNGQVVLELHEDVCNDSFTFECARQPCQQRTTRCRLPALSAGDYALVASGSPTRLIRVREGGQGSCSLSPARQ